MNDLTCSWMISQPWKSSEPILLIEWVPVQRLNIRKLFGKMFSLICILICWILSENDTKYRVATMAVSCGIQCEFAPSSSRALLSTVVRAFNFISSFWPSHHYNGTPPIPPDHFASSPFMNMLRTPAHCAPNLATSSALTCFLLSVLFSSVPHFTYNLIEMDDVIVSVAIRTSYNSLIMFGT